MDIALTTVLDATKDGPAIVIPRYRKRYAIGDLAYRFSQTEPLPPHATGRPVMYVDGRWQLSALGNNIVCKWTAMVRRVDDPEIQGTQHE